MVETYFNVRYEFDKIEVERQIDNTLANNCHGYIVVADGVVLNIAQREKRYRRILEESMFAICDSSWVPLYVKLIYGHHREQYCGAMIFQNLVSRKCNDGHSKYRMAFLGTNESTLQALKRNIAQTMNDDVFDMLFYELPYCNVEEFDYPSIANMLEKYRADIVWIALGAPKQEIFMNLLDKHMNRGVQIAVGAVFKFFSGCEEARAPQWLVKLHLEFLYRIYQAPKKQLKRCMWILIMLPKMLIEEINRKNKQSE